MFVSRGLVIICLFIAGLQGQTQGQKEWLYAAKKELFNQNFIHALPLLDKVVQSGYDKPLAQDALFWKGYCLEKLNQPEEALIAYRTLLNEFPQSKWSDDCENNITRLCGRLVQSGKEKYKNTLYEKLKSNYKGVRLHALLALTQVGDSSATIALTKHLEKEVDPVYRFQMIKALSNNKTATAYSALSRSLTAEKNDRTKKYILTHLQKAQCKIPLAPVVEIARKSPQQELRLQALAVLARYEIAETRNVFLQVFRHDSQPQIRIKALQLLQPIGEKSIQQEILQVFDKAPTAVRLEVLDALKGSLDSTFISNINEIINSSDDPEIAVRLLDITNSIESPRVVSVVHQMVQRYSDPYIYSKALSILDKYDQPNSIPTLSRIYHKASEPSTKLYILSIVDDIRNEASIPLLAEAIEDHNKHVKLFAIDVLKKIPSKQAREIMVRKLDSDSPEIKYKILSSIGEEKTPDIVPQLTQLIETESNRDLKIMAMNMLTHYPGEQSILALQNIAARDRDDRTRMHALNVLEEIKAEASVTPAVEILFKDKSDSLRLFAANTIYRAGGSEAVVFLKKAVIKDPSMQVRQQALENLFLLDKEEAQEAGVQLLKIYK